MQPSMFLLSAVLAICPAADLARVDRTLKKEPTYKHKPKYCLLVFGPEAKARIWLVMDLEVLYVDRNGDGDLTEPGERVRIETFGFQSGFRAGTADLGAAGRYDLAVLSSIEEGLVVAQGRYLQTTSYIRFANRPADAPIVHFDGPLTMAPYESGEIDKLIRGADEFRIMIGTPGLGHGTFASLSQVRYQNGAITLLTREKGAEPTPVVPEGVHPVAEVEFRPTAKGKPLLLKRYILNQRC